eukprot:c5072_g1_i2.p2 GENE.c5072_g1_i2~~c5072_g1_i2.p2  ORF type:complete len:161 (+),score=24.78 c5072_g1_i2:529-1011(+)
MTRRGTSFVPTSDAQAFAKKIGAAGFYEVSTREYTQAMRHLPDATILSPSFFTPAGGVDSLFSTIFKLGSGAMLSSLSKGQTKRPGLLSRVFSRVVGAKTKNTDATSQAGFDKALALLMCRHSRLGQACPEPMREVPNDVWLSIFRLVAANTPDVEFFRS